MGIRYLKFMFFIFTIKKIIYWYIHIYNRNRGLYVIRGNRGSGVSLT